MADLKTNPNQDSRKTVFYENQLIDSGCNYIGKRGSDRIIDSRTREIYQVVSSKPHGPRPKKGFRPFELIEA
jgi:hypothetical protein